MKISGYSKGTSSQLWDEDHPFGEKRAREIALRCHLDETAFQIASTDAHPAHPTKGANTGKFPTRGQTLGEQYDLLSAEEQWRFEHLLAAAQDQPPPMGEPFKWERKGKSPATVGSEAKTRAPSAKRSNQTRGKVRQR